MLQYHPVSLINPNTNRCSLHCRAHTNVTVVTRCRKLRVLDLSGVHKLFPNMMSYYRRHMPKRVAGSSSQVWDTNK